MKALGVQIASEKQLRKVSTIDRSVLITSFGAHLLLRGRKPMRRLERRTWPKDPVIHILYLHAPYRSCTHQQLLSMRYTSYALIINALYCLLQGHGFARVEIAWVSSRRQDSRGRNVHKKATSAFCRQSPLVSSL